jgi:glycopeptide antibiotics resistance protein
VADINMHLPNRQTWFAILTAAVVIVILFLCLSPFRFSVRHGNINAISALVGSWANPLQPIDFVLNIALYLPLGIFGALSSPRRRHPWWSTVFVTAGGALLSVAVELAQYFDAARYTAASDVYANVLGTFLGATVAVLLFRR